MKRTKPGIETPVQSELDEYKNAVVKLTDLMTDLIGTQRETLKLISSLGKMTMGINAQLDTVTKIVIGKDNFESIVHKK
jgi:hypothetical protein